MTIAFTLLVVGSYLLGSVPAAYLAAKFACGIDIREFGSGNIGAGNLIRATSQKTGAVVAAFDFFKGLVMVWAAQMVGLDLWQQVVVGLAAITGHNWPVFLRFNGGRGVITSVGVAFILIPWGIPVFCAVAAISLLIKTTPVPVLAAVAALPLLSWAMDKPLEVTGGLAVILLIMVIRRLTAPRKFPSPISIRELLINRFLFDRDIRDAKAWMNNEPDKPGQEKSVRKLEK